MLCVTKLPKMPKLGGAESESGLAHESQIHSVANCVCVCDTLCAWSKFTLLVQSLPLLCIQNTQMPTMHISLSSLAAGALQRCIAARSAVAVVTRVAKSHAEADFPYLRHLTVCE